MRLGALVYTLSLYHPLRLIEEICVLDALSGGRLDVGIGRGVSPIELRYYGVDPEQAQQQYIEASEILLKGLGARTLTHEGRHFNFRDVPIEMAPVQSPRPPLWYGVGQPDTAVWAAGMGINVMCNGPVAHVAQRRHRFREAWAASGEGARRDAAARPA
jgi:alkanesulfonate monooxygenase SsuD/methylene tetrahydromethanopterin reductase-like flavin-dependent oxidoreductase (luciferase family)